MWKFISDTIIKRFTLNVYIAIINCFGLSMSGYGQQYVIADKDNTHPEITLQTSLPALITRFNVQRANDYIEVAWATLREQDIRKYIIEYSNNGTDFHSAGEVFSNKVAYNFKIPIANNLHALFRIIMVLLYVTTFF